MVAIPYHFLVLGGLVLKQVALSVPDAIAARIAPMMNTITRITDPLVWELGRSGRPVLDLLGQAEMQG